ncbi:hypothetical protein Q8F55_006515 [Vanrija albida]|uniref:Asl1-like glycosyl hydrolase catalytic domain-containing protein n=1 Tax=Vanrija albida TaxID=181172 RepID=A0ABR3PXQ4_9TREE
MGQGKGGISWPIQEETSDPVAKFFQPGSKLSWHYNWNKNWDVLLPGTSPNLSIDAEFVPMIFAPSYLNNEFTLQAGWKLLLGYNEPDHVDPEVAVPTTPADAARAWVELAKLRTEGTKLVSPAVAGNLDWLKEWFSLIPEDTRPDFLAVHVYTTTFDDFRRQVENYHDTFKLPIIVTEFAMTSFDPNVPPPQSMQQVHDFMGQTTAWLDATDWIERFAWFGAVRNAYNLHGVHEFNRLMDADGELTALGHQYVQGGHE